MTQEPLTCNSVLSQSVWLNNFIRIGGKVIKRHFDKELFVSDLYVGNKLLNWQAFKRKFDLRQQDHFTWIQIVNAIPIKWKKIIEDSQIVIHPHIIQHSLMLTREIPLEKLTSKYIYTMKIMKIKEIQTSQNNIESQIQESDLRFSGGSQRPPAGTKCIGGCIFEAGRWGASWCNTANGNWGTGCVPCPSGKIFNTYQIQCIY